MACHESHLRSVVDAVSAAAIRRATADGRPRDPRAHEGTRASVSGNPNVESERWMGSSGHLSRRTSKTLPTVATTPDERATDTQRQRTEAR